MEPSTKSRRCLESTHRTRTARAALACLTVAWALSGCTTAWISAWLAQRERAEQYRPVWQTDEQSDASQAPPVTTTHVVAVRVYADRDFRSHVPGWQREIRRYFAAANRLLSPIGVRLDPGHPIAWQRDSDDSLHKNLDALVRHDPGRNVALVLGFVSALPVFTDDSNRLGLASLLGKHAVVRAIDARLELEHMMRTLKMHTRKEVEALYAEGRWHKKGVLIVHEWAHTLGAKHATHSRELFMYPRIDRRQHRFCRLNEMLIRLGLRHRGGNDADTDHAAWGREAVNLFEGEKTLSTEQRHLLRLFERMGNAKVQVAKRESTATSKAQRNTSAKNDDASSGRNTTSAKSQKTTKVEARRSRSTVKRKERKSQPEGARYLGSVAVVEERDTGGCRILGLERAMVTTTANARQEALEAAHAQLVEAAAKMGGNTVSAFDKSRKGAVVLLGTIYYCD